MVAVSEALTEIEQGYVVQQFDTESWKDFREKLKDTPYEIVTMLCSMKPKEEKSPQPKTGGKDNAFLQKVQMIPFIKRVLSKHEAPTKAARGKVGRVRKAFKSVTCTFELEGATLRIFQNGSVGLLGVRGFEQLFKIAHLFQCFVHPVQLSVSSIVISAHVSAILPMVLRPGFRISLAALSRQLNTDPQWQHSDFSAQKRATNLNLRYLDGFKPVYASVFPRGMIRVTTTNADTAIHILNSLKLNLIKLGMLATCVDLSQKGSVPTQIMEAKATARKPRY